MSTESTATKKRKTRRAAPSPKINVTIAPSIHEALGRKGAPLNKSAGEYVQHFLEMAFSHPQGCHFKLEALEPVKADEDTGPKQQQLPLDFDSTGQASAQQ